MNGNREEILRLLAEGTVTAREAEDLLAAIGPRPEARWKRWSNPLEHLSTTQAFVVALLGVLVGIALHGWVRFDGAFDLHVSRRPDAWSVAPGLPWLEVIVYWPLCTLVFWVAARLAKSRGRFVDFGNAVGVSHALLLLLVPLMWLFPSNEDVAEYARQGTFPVTLVIALILVIPVTIAYFAVLFRSFRTASGLTGSKLVLVFIVAAIAAELLSKVALSIAT